VYACPQPCLSGLSCLPALLQDCSIQVSPITDPACADPTSEIGYPYGSIQMTAYYATTSTIRSLMSPKSDK